MAQWAELHRKPWTMTLCFESTQVCPPTSVSHLFFKISKYMILTKLPASLCHLMPLIFLGILPSGGIWKGKRWAVLKVLDTLQNSDTCPLLTPAHSSSCETVIFFLLLGKQNQEKKSPTALVCRLENMSTQWKGIFPREEITVHLLLSLLSWFPDWKTLQLKNADDYFLGFLKNVPF